MTPEQEQILYELRAALRDEDERETAEEDLRDVPKAVDKARAYSVAITDSAKKASDALSELRKVMGLIAAVAEGSAVLDNWLQASDDDDPEFMRAELDEALELVKSVGSWGRKFARSTDPLVKLAEKIR